MINTNFSLNSSVNLNKVIAKFSSRPSFKVTFDPDRYSAVKVKFTPKPEQKQVTASIFSTGKIIVTGAQTLDEIAGAYETINKVITTDALVKAVKEPELFNNIMGASFEEWGRVLHRTRPDE
jgi:TATA-box binding protein (TBP) (component of TFIID and TFIIIB)